MPLSLPVYADVVKAAERIHGHAHRTPVMRSRTVDAEFGAEVFFKCENLQRMGAFKFRGAFNALSKFDARRREAGVVAFSSGNHAQAVALSARLLGIPATIVMPKDAPAMKIAATKGYGGEGTVRGRGADGRPVRLSGRRRPAFRLRPVGAGALPRLQDLRRRAGSGQRRAAILPQRRNRPHRPPKTIADGAQTQHLGQLTFPIIRRDVADILTVSDAELIDAMEFFAARMKIVVEPTGCLGFAAARAMRTELAGKRVGVIISGGNVDMRRFCELLMSRG